MDLTRRPGWLSRVALLPGLAVLAACSSSEAPFEFTEDNVSLPATLREAHVLAERLARSISGRAYVTEMGGGFTIMNSEGRARHHSFLFHAREGLAVNRAIEIDLVSGAAWLRESLISDSELRPPFTNLDAVQDSDAAVVAALAVADSVNTDRPGTVPIPTGVGDPEAFEFAARIKSVPQWPEQFPLPPHARIAWRVDFLIEKAVSESSVPVPFSTARFYFDPVTLELLGDPIVPPQPELYPRP